MTVSLSPILNGYQSFLASGLPNNGGFIYAYLAGTTTPATTYTTSAGTIPNSNPIILSASGVPPSEIWLTVGAAYKFVVTDSTSAPVAGASFDNISLMTASMVSNTPAGGISATTVQAALNELDTKKQPNIGYTPVNKAGDTMAGILVTYPSAGPIGVVSGSFGLEVQSSNAGDAAFMAFVRNGIFGGYFGLDTDNTWKVGGMNSGAVSYNLLHSGNVNTYAVGLAGAQTIAGVKTFSSPPIAVNACKAWVNFDGTLTGTIAPRASFNISSVTKNGTGDYTVAYPAMSDINYAPIATVAGNGSQYLIVGRYSTIAQTATSSRFIVAVVNGGLSDTNEFTLAIFGN